MFDRVRGRRFTVPRQRPRTLYASVRNKRPPRTRNDPSPGVWNKL